MSTASNPSDPVSDRRPTRTEIDDMGPVEVPAEALWGAHTQRAVDNFPVSGHRMPRPVLRALALIKSEAAAVNAASDHVPQVTPEIGAAIVDAADQVGAGLWDDQFLVDVYQTGSGTSTNMNVNEVIARLASQALGVGAAVHPNDHVNASQSSNDVFPTAVHIGVLSALAEQLDPELEAAETTLDRRSVELAGVVKVGRTHLSDALPVSLGLELAAYARQISACRARLADARTRLGEVPLGGTAVGTGFGAPPGFGEEVVARLASRTGLPLVVAPSRLALQAAHDTLVETSGHLRVLAVALTKIASDLAWMASGPTAGLAEIRLPALQPGSSMMPGKVNPVLAETTIQVAAQVVGNDAAVAWAGARGQFELHAAGPVMAYNVLESVRLLTNTISLLRVRYLEGIEADVERCARLARESPALATALVPRLGYDRVADLVQRAAASGVAFRDLAIAEGHLTGDEYDEIIDDALTFDTDNG